jgi:hypothetical protein
LSGDTDTYEREDVMAQANRKSLGRSTRDTERQQREEMPVVEGATGGADDHSEEAAAEQARKRLGKTEKHTSGD